MVIGISAVLGDVASQEYVENVISSCKDEQVSSLGQTIRSTVLTGPRICPALMEAAVPTSIPARSVGMHPMVAEPSADPCLVCMPVSPIKVEALLCSFNIYDKWLHIIDGLLNGFDVGIKSLQLETILF